MIYISGITVKETLTGMDDWSTCNDNELEMPVPLSSHSTRLQKTAAKSLVIPRTGEGDKVSLREFND